MRGPIAASAIIDEGAASTPVTLQNLDRLTQGHYVPSTFRLFASRPEYWTRIPSVTACYLDLADRVVRTSDDGALLHFLSDQQWCAHWYVHLDGTDEGCVFVGYEPIGFDLGDEDPATPIPAVVPLDGSFEIFKCEDNFERFLYRFWVENTLWSVEQGHLAPTPETDAYVRFLA